VNNLIFLLLLGILGGVLSWAGVRMIRNYAISRQLSLTGPEVKMETPRGGGLAILVVVLLIFMPMGLSLVESEPSQVVRFALSGAFIGVIGFLDDLRTLPRVGRLTLQTLAALIFVPAAPIREIGLPFLNLQLSDVASYIVSTLWIVILTNAYNYMDGLDGLAGGQAVIAGGLWAGVGIVEGNPLIILLGLLIAGASAGFLVYNLPPASVFMGDVGTTFLGFSLAALPMLAMANGSSPRLIITGGVIMGLFLFDAALTFARYALKGQGRSHIHRSHLYQRLVKLGDSSYRVTGLYLLISVGFGVAGLIYWISSTWMALLVCALACLALFAWITQREMSKQPASRSQT
jgi:UDP-N-acetylmuramyl pentapeptide phosphotransferase/UDP-N-acetylglucosamine-1-phosphate transferase